jgi:hypothetical protein
MEYCGIDLHQVYSQICILNDEGEVMETSRVRTSRPGLSTLTLPRLIDRQRCSGISSLGVGFC